jgi:hypothetical protein
MALNFYSGKSLAVALVVVIGLALVWAVAGAIAQPRLLAKYHEDYQDAKFAQQNAWLISILVDEKAVDAARVFARDYEGLDSAGYLTAPIRSVATSMSHDEYETLVNPTDREKFEQERKEREERQAREDEERLKEIREKEKQQEEAE